MRLLEGSIVEDMGGSDTDSLRDENRELRSELQQARRDIEKIKHEVGRSVSELRRQLTPLYRALQAVFGEMDEIGDYDSPSAPNSKTAAVWDAWKTRIGGQPAKLIDAFLLHGEMTAAQIAIAIHVNPKNVAQVVHKLNRAGLIQKNGNLYALKKL